MPEPIRAVQHRWRLGAQRAQRIAAGEQVAHECLAARDQLIGEDVPRPSLEPALAQQRGKLRRALRPDGEIVVEDDPLSVEEEALSLRRRIVEQVVDERDEPVPEAARGVVPLTVPVRVRDDQDPERGWHARSVRGAHSVHKRWGIAPPSGASHLRSEFHISGKMRRGADREVRPARTCLSSASSDDWATARDQSVHDHDERQDEKQVNEPAAYMEGEGTQRPQNEKDDRKCEEHGVHPRVSVKCNSGLM